MVGPRKKLARKRSPTREATSRPGIERTVFSLSEDETFHLGRTIGQQLEGGELLLLEGDLGLGKTVLARGIAAGLGISADDVTSPSFTLVQEYSGGRAPMFHVDLYRLETPDDIESIGLADILSSQAAVVVEWGERLPDRYKVDAVVIRLHDVGEGSRRIEVLSARKATRDRPSDA